MYFDGVHTCTLQFSNCPLEMMAFFAIVLSSVSTFLSRKREVKVRTKMIAIDLFMIHSNELVFCGVVDFSPLAALNNYH